MAHVVKALVALALLVPLAHAAADRVESRDYVNGGNWSWGLTPFVVDCDAFMPPANPVDEIICFAIDGEREVALSLADAQVARPYATVTFSDAPLFGSTLFAYQHFCGAVTLPIPEGTTRIEIHLQPGNGSGAPGHDPGCEQATIPATRGTLTATFR